MKILVITPACHFKSTGAAQRDIYATTALLKDLGHEVALYSIDSPQQDHAVLESSCASSGIPVRYVLPLKNMYDRVARCLRHPGLFDGAAYVFDNMARDLEVRRYFVEEKPDIVLSFCSYSWPILRFARFHHIRTIFRSHNFESSFFWETLTTGQKLRPSNWLRYVTKYIGERKAVRYADAIATLPFEQMKKYNTWKKKNVFLFTLTFLGESLGKHIVHREKKLLDIFYLGASYNVIFHLRGARLLIEEIAPRVLQQAKDKFTFHILGSKLPQHLVEKCANGIVYEGYVPDLDAFLGTMDIGAFPVMTGNTMKGKVFDSLARSFPLVLSTNCLGGYDLKNGKEVLLADTADAFVEKILQLGDSDEREALSRNAKEFSQRHFSHQHIQSVLADILNAVS